MTEMSKEAATGLPAVVPNDVIIKCADITAITYKRHSMEVSPGQIISQDPIASLSKGDWTISTECGRVGSESVADRYKGILGRAENMFSAQRLAGSDKTPQKLNFYFAVNVTFRIRQHNFGVTFFLGQGHQLVPTPSNNWWIGGENIVRGHGNTCLLVVTNDLGGVEQTYLIQQDDNMRFSLKPTFNAAQAAAQVEMNVPDMAAPLAAMASEGDDNTVTIRLADDNAWITGLKYFADSLRKAPGQPSAATPTFQIKDNGRLIEITFKCGRHGESSLAREYLQKFDNNWAHMLSAAGAFSPDKLNLYFTIGLEIIRGNQNLMTEFTLAQGHVPGENNWWIASKNIAKYEYGYPVFKTLVVTTSPLRPENVHEIMPDGHKGFLIFDPWIPGKPVIQPRASWMKGLSGDLPIFAINIPGTHDSAAIPDIVYATDNAISYTSLWSCQNQTITAQLNSGVRLLDIRLIVVSQHGRLVFYTCHGDMIDGTHIKLGMYAPLVEVIKECKDFLAMNPSEFIAMSVKIDDWNGLSGNKTEVFDALARVLSGSDFYARGNVPKLKDVRKKIYLLNRVNNEERLGAPLKPDFGATEGMWMQPAYPRDFPVYVQDRYEDLGSAPEKKKLQLFLDATAQNAPGAPGEHLIYNFASGTKPSYFIHSIPCGVYINSELINYYGRSDQGPRPAPKGWSLFDYGNTVYGTNIYGYVSIYDIIIASNFPPGTPPPPAGPYQEPYKSGG